MRSRTYSQSVRGSACVELMLSVTFLVLFCLAMNDFARGFRSAQQGQRAARHLAWAKARTGVAPDANVIHALHYEGRGGEVTTALGGESKNALFDFLQEITGALDAIFQPVDSEHIAQGHVIDDVGRIGRMASFLTGNIHMTRASSHQAVSGLRRVGTDANAISQSHWVSLFADPESNPTDPKGWIDLLDLLDTLFGSFVE